MAKTELYELDEQRTNNAKLVMADRDITIEGAMEFAEWTISEMENYVKSEPTGIYFEDCISYFDNEFLNEVYKNFDKYIMQKKWNRSHNAHGASAGNVLRYLMQLFMQTSRYLELFEKVDILYGRNINNIDYERD